MKVMKKGFNFSQDGAGNRLVYHLQGCNMRCPWCANPEGIAINGSFLVHENKLINSVCPHGNINEGTVNRQRCEACRDRQCLASRRNAGIEYSCHDVGEDEIIKEAKESRPLFFDGGGVTFTGGEPTLQFSELLSVAKGLHDENISVAIETNASSATLEHLFPFLDILIMDFKHIDPELHRKYTGISNAVIMQNIEKAMKHHKNVLIRTPLINHFNGEARFCKAFIDFYKQFPLENTRFELLKYHEYGVSKWGQIGMKYAMEDGFVSDEIKNFFETEYKKNGLAVVNT